MKRKVRLISSIVVLMIIVIGFRVGQLYGRDIPIDLKTYIGQASSILSKGLMSNGIESIIDEDNIITKIQINREGYWIDSIQVGDSIDKIYKVYPEEWINAREHSIEIIYGKENHFGVATEHIIFTIGNENKVQSIILGQITPFTGLDLPNSNVEAKQYLEGKWKSNSAHILEFNGYAMKDSYLDNLWTNQSYIITSPNSLIIYRQKENQEEKVKINFWVTKDRLYVFSIDLHGKPIQESIEIFYKI